MSEMSAALGNAAPPHQIDHEGRVYSFWLLDGARKTQLEKRFYQRARELAFLEKDITGEEEYQRKLAELSDAFHNNEFGLTGPRGSKMGQTPKGATTLLEVITGESEDDLIPLLLARKVEVMSLLKVIIDDSFKRPRKPKEAPNG